jgi:undecaprenyl-phosphate 4-deoxy-4-formamido-L-arabinose transferase
MDISIVIPVYNGETTIKEITRQIVEVLSESKMNYEVIFVYDCGPDNSWEVIVGLVEEYEKVKGVKLSRNFGQHNAILSGIEIALGEFIVTMDEDLQHSPKDILTLLSKQKVLDSDVVYGKYKGLKHSAYRNWTSILMKRMLKSTLPDLHQEYSAFRLIRKSIAKEILKMNNSYTFLDGYLSWLTKDVDFVEVDHFDRQGGESSYSVKMLIEHSVNIFVTFSNFPIRFLTKSSILIFILTFCYSLYVTFRKFFYDDLALGFPTLVIVLGFGIGSIMLGIGILGEYLYRVNLKTTNRPNYYIKELKE